MMSMGGNLRRAIFGVSPKEMQDQVSRWARPLARMLR